jgi:hypothetical protein
MAFGTIDTIEAGTMTILNTVHPLRHVLGRAGWGWYVTNYAGGGMLERTEHFQGSHAETRARAAFDALRAKPRITTRGEVRVPPSIHTAARPESKD